MNRSSIFKRKIDFKNSGGSYLFDKDTKKKYLDFFGQYATLALGYNHPIFKTDDYINEITRVAHQKITNCEIFSDESAEFDESFQNYTSKGIFTHYHYSCTGALAVEAAIKTAMDYKGQGHHRVISFKKSFHGINGYGGIFTDRFEPVNQRLKGFPGAYWEPIENPVIKYENGRKIVDNRLVQDSLFEIEDIITNQKNVCAILVEPIQCTFGDRYFPDDFFKGVRQLATKYDVPLIFDEIQVGFGGTGKLWYFEHLPIIPDILVFGKKTQLSGIAVQEKFSKIFEKSIRLEVTWDADIMDMIRCKYIIQAYKKYEILKNIDNMAARLMKGLSNIIGLQNIRSCGLLFAFDFDAKRTRDAFLQELLQNNMLCNPTGDNTIRLRPNLCVNTEEIDHALFILNKAGNKI